MTVRQPTAQDDQPCRSAPDQVLIDRGLLDQTREPMLRRLRGWGYLFGIAVASTCGCSFFLGGLVAGATGFSGIALAAGFPLAGFLWAITLSAVFRNARHQPLPRPPRQRPRPKQD